MARTIHTDRDRRPTPAHFWDHNCAMWRTTEGSQVPPMRLPASPRPVRCAWCHGPLSQGKCRAGCGGPQ